MEVTIMANTSKILETVKTINDSLNKIADDFNPVDALVVLEHISNICGSIANNVSYVTEYRVNTEGIKCAIKIINPDSEDPLLKKLTDYIDKFGDDDDDTAPLKLKSEEAHIIDVMMDRITDKVNSIDNEVDAIKDHLTELGLGLDATCDNDIEDDDGFDCREDVITIYDKLAHIDDQIINLSTNDDNLEVDVEEHGERLDRLSSTIEELSNRLTSIEIFNAQLCATLVQDKRFRKNFDRTAKKIRKSVKAIKHVDKSINTDKLEKEIKPSEE
jgi:hypothetical protein